MESIAARLRDCVGTEAQRRERHRRHREDDTSNDASMNEPHSGVGFLRGKQRKGDTHARAVSIEHDCSAIATKSETTANWTKEREINVILKNKN